MPFENVPNEESGMWCLPVVEAGYSRLRAMQTQTALANSFMGLMRNMGRAVGN